MFYTPILFLRSAFLSLVLLVLTGCGQAESTRPVAPPKGLAEWFAISVGGRTVQMQLALLPEEQEHGLMDRRDLGPDQGMIFIFPHPQAMNFWMHDTPTPLDVGYFSPEGELKEIYPMYAYDERTVSSHGDQLQLALEMNLGWFHGHGVGPGAKIDLAALKQAIAARGFTPQQLGLP
jgi:uncharacterized membrane protein (UPF0127 family)